MKSEPEALYARRAAAWPVLSETMELLMRIRNIAALSARYRVYALDSIIDVGRSVARRGISTPDDLALWLDEVLGVLVPEGSLNLMGMSYGGWLAGLYALRSPERVRRLVLLAPGGSVLRFSFWFFARVMFLALRRTLCWVFRDMVESGEAGRAYVEQDVAAILKSGRSPRAAVRRLERVAPSVRAEIVPGAGHDLTFVQPGLVAARELEFLAA